MLRQLDLFGAPGIGFDAEFRGLVRRELAHGAWVEHQPGWVTGHAAMFDQLEQALTWRTETRRMYDRTVTTPRLLASIRRGAPAAPVMADGSTRRQVSPEVLAIIEPMRLALSARYGEEFVRVTAALYRDGDDSVAFHGDTTARDMEHALVATVSLGHPRRFLMKPTEGGESVAFPLGRGDLTVMGGTCQRTWRHGIPKVTTATGPRIAVMFRPAWSASYDD